jgi:hypothetical protein
MKPYEFIIRLLTKLLLIASRFVLIIGGFAIDGDSAFATRMIVTGIAMAMPDIAVWIIDGFYADEKE